MFKFRIWALALVMVLSLSACSDDGGKDEAGPDDGYTMVGSNQVAKILAKDKGQRVVILNFWTTWCPGCRMEVKELNELRGEFPADKLAIYGISLEEAPEALDRFRQIVPIKYRVMIGDKSLAQSYRIRAIPRMLIYGKDGKIALDHEGVITAKELVPAINKLLGE